MVVGAISGAAASGACGRRSLCRVEPVDAGSAAGHDAGPHAHGGGAGRALVPAGPSPSTGPRAPLRHSAPFIAQVAAAHLGSLPDAERRIRRMPDLVQPRAGAAYGRTARLPTELPTGFLVARDL